jgi:predicted RNA binding protein YcfA (HicA-like mRNA interferase family)
MTLYEFFRSLLGSGLSQGPEESWLRGRQRGSRIILRRESPHARVVVPNHMAIRMGTLRTILHEAGLTVDELIELL